MRHTGVTLQELLLRLTPLASRLEVLDLSKNQLGGTITNDITVFSKLKKLNMSNMGLDGKPLSIRSERPNGSLTCNLVCACTGELPIEIIRMKAKGVEVSLSRNAGFTLPSNIGELGGDITKLDLSSCSLTGPRSTRC